MATATTRRAAPKWTPRLTRKPACGACWVCCALQYAQLFLSYQVREYVGQGQVARVVADKLAFPRAVTGMDLVQDQLRVGPGEPLS